MAEFDEFGSPVDGNWWDYIQAPSNEEAPMGSDVNLEPTPAQQIDYSGATYVGSSVPLGADQVSESAVVDTFKWDDGSQISVNPRGEIVAYQPPYSSYENKENIRAGYQNIPYAFSSLRGGDDGSGYTTFQGQKVPVFADEYVIDPDTGKVVLDERGNPIIQGTLNPNMGGENWVQNTGAATMLAMAGIGGLGGIGEAGALTGATESGLGLLSNPIIKAALTNAGYGALTGGATAALTGQDALKGALIGGASGALLGGGEAALFPEAAGWASGSVSNAGLLGAGRGAAGGVINTLLGGGDLKQNVLYGAGLGGALGAGSEYFFPSAQTSFANKEGEAPRWASVQDTLENAQQVLDKYTPNQLKLSMTDADYSGFGIDPRVRTGGGYDILDPEYITNRGGYGQGGYSGVGIDPEVEQLWGGQGLNPNIEYYTRGLANNAEALSQTSGIDVTRNEFDARGGLTAEQEAALDRALTAADYASTPNWLSGLGNLGTLLSAGTLSRLTGGAGGAAGRAAAGGGSFVPKGMVDYSGILNLLAPKTSTRASLLG